jgi:type I restriction enzyme, S subunit
MIADWQIVNFGEAPLQIIDGDRGKNYPKQDEFLKSGHCLFLNTGNVTTSGFKFNDCQFVTEAKDNVLRKGKLSREDVVMTTRGTIGNVAYYNKNIPFENIRINSGMVIFRAEKDKLLPSFLYQYLRSKQFNKQVNSLRSGAAQPQLPIRDIKVIEILLPPILQQEAISELISKYDDLIENNKRRIELLEESARQLYKEWFVRLRFPGHEHVKIIDSVPEGWKKRLLKEIANITMGQSPKSEFYNSDGEGLPFHQGVTKFGFRFVQHETYCTKPTRLSQPGDILFSVRAPVGRLNITNDVIVLGRGLSAIHSIDGYQSFLFYALKSYFFKEDMIGGGAIYASVTKKNLENQELLTPSNALLEEFNDFASDIDKQIYSLHQINVNLTKARDILLPKLMSGEVAV